MCHTASSTFLPPKSPKQLVWTQNYENDMIYQHHVTNITHYSNFFTVVNYILIQCLTTSMKANDFIAVYILQI